MPRDSNGVYSLPAGNPVVTLTTISSGWANPTMSDIALALTNSLDRAGSGGMTGQLKLANGLVGAPALSWGTEPTSGLYRNAAGDFRYSVGSNDKLAITATLFTISPATTISTGPLTLSAGQFLAPDGTVALPSLSFGSDPNTGLYRPSADVVNVSTGGAVATTFTSQGTGINDGTAALPSLYFFNDTNTGLYRIGADNFGLTTGGVNVLDVTSGRAIIAGLVYVPDGSAGFPSLSFTSDNNTGFYRPSADVVNVTTGGTVATTHTAQGTGVNDGSAGSPSFYFFNDVNTGIYRPTADQLFFAENGQGFRIGFREVPQNIQNGNYTLLVEDTGKHILKNGGAGNTITIPANASVAFPIGTVVVFVNTAGVAVNIACGDTLTFAGSGVTGTRVLAGTAGEATALKITATNWVISGSGLT